MVPSAGGGESREPSKAVSCLHLCYNLIRKDAESEESLAIRLILELMWVHRLRSTTPLWLYFFD